MLAPQNDDRLHVETMPRQTARERYAARRLEIAGRLRKARLKAGLSQEVVAKHIGMERSGYSRIENGLWSIPSELIVVTAHAVKISAIDLIA